MPFRPGRFGKPSYIETYDELPFVTGIFPATGTCSEVDRPGRPARSWPKSTPGGSIRRWTPCSR